jgi:hypothetical protein
MSSDGIFMVTGASLHKEHLFPTAEKLNLLEHELLTLAKQHEWQLEAWAVFVNHYHFVARGHDKVTPTQEVSPTPALEYCSQVEPA